MNCRTPFEPARVAAGVALALLAGAGCRSPETYRRQADETATNMVTRLRAQTVGQNAPFTIERPADTLRRRLLLDQQLPGSLGTTNLRPRIVSLAAGKAVRLTLGAALQVGARNNRAYQQSKEAIFMAALALDLERVKLGALYDGQLSSAYLEDHSGAQPVRGVDNNVTAKVTRKFATGAAFTGRLALDLVKLLTLDRDSALGLLADATITVPLLRGASRAVVLEPLTQAERNVVYAIYDFERYKAVYAVDIADGYLAVLQQSQQVQTAGDSHARLLAGWRQARELAQAGRLPEIQVDQAQQAELQARNRLLDARQSYEAALDGLKVKLGLPTDARVELDPQEFTRLAVSASHLQVAADAPETAPLEIKAAQALPLALARRMDLKVARGQVEDAQRAVVVARDGLRADLKLTAAARVGESRSLYSASRPNARFSPASGNYRAGLELDLPWERTAERNAYRNSLIALEQTVRAQQETEDQIKLEVRRSLRNLQNTREAYLIQEEALRLAQRRVESTQRLLPAGQALMRDALDAQDALVLAQNAVNAALVGSRVAELQLQRDMDVLAVDEEGLWQEYKPASSP
ncbi:MAG: TolC family protein [Kiritimatiellaeota bacterium]|nr:TolC family protein [Kiritimatiellota bacterium]